MTERDVPAAGEPAASGIEVDVLNGVATLTLSTPGRRNALTRRILRELPGTLRELARDAQVRVLVVRGAGGDFSAGADIADLDAVLAEQDPGTPDGGDITVAEEALAAFPKPSVAALGGYCVGAGWELAAACDLRIAGADLRLGITPARLGVVYPLSGLTRLVRLVGPGVAKDLLLTGELVDAATALGWGLVTRVADGDPVAAAQELAGRMTRLSQFSLAAHAGLVDAIASGVPGTPDAPDVAGLRTAWQARSGGGEDAAIGVAAFLAKQEPRFTWRG